MIAVRATYDSFPMATIFPSSRANISRLGRSFFDRNSLLETNGSVENLDEAAIVVPEKVRGDTEDDRGGPQGLDLGVSVQAHG